MRVPFLELSPNQLGVTDDMFMHKSDIHGAAHVNRVIFNVFQLCELSCNTHLASRAWAAAYIHDLYRVHDEYCTEHGGWAADNAYCYEELFFKAGVLPRHIPSIMRAVKYHSLPDELEEDDVDWTLTAILKDADALDRCRLGERGLDPKYLRLEESHNLIEAAEALYKETLSIPHPFSKVMKIGKEIYYG